MPDAPGSDRLLNFSAGPSMLPLEVLERVQTEWLDFAGTGMSLVEHSHRGATYLALHRETLHVLREVGEVPDEFEVLLMAGGASQQFALIPMNLLADVGSADVIVSGRWAQKALEHARATGRTVRVAGSSEPDDFRHLPRNDEIDVDPRSRYVHVVTNNTVVGTRFDDWPETNGVPIVADMTSEFMARPVPWDRVDLVFAGTQKNLGISGLTAVFVRTSILPDCRSLPAMLSYRAWAEVGSLPNTPPMMQVWLTKLVLEWTRSQGGTVALAERASERAALVYAALDARPQFYSGRCPTADRSPLNLVFHLPSPDLEARFLVEAEQLGMVNLWGHRTVGGIRASMYNAMPIAGAERLAGFMTAFATRNG